MTTKKDTPHDNASLFSTIQDISTQVDSYLSDIDKAYEGIEEAKRNYNKAIDLLREVADSQGADEMVRVVTKIRNFLNAI